MLYYCHAFLTSCQVPDTFHTIIYRLQNSLLSKAEHFFLGPSQLFLAATTLTLGQLEVLCHNLPECCQQAVGTACPVSSQVGMGMKLVDFEWGDSLQVFKLWVGLLLLVKEVCRLLLLFESSLLSVCFTFWQQGKLCMQSCRRCPLKNM